MATGTAAHWGGMYEAGMGVAVGVGEGIAVGDEVGEAGGGDPAARPPRLQAIEKSVKLRRIARMLRTVGICRS